MKGLQGLIVAVGLGIAGAMFNWIYLASRSHDVEKVGFVGIDPKVTAINRGEVLQEEQLVEVGIPKQGVGNLVDFAVPYSARQTVIGQPVWRTLSGGTFLLADDLKTPPQELKLGEDEKAMWIPIESREFVPSLVAPGDLVSFIVPQVRTGPTPAASRGHTSPEDATDRVAVGPTEIIGPFRILSLGNRLGSSEVMRAAKIPQVQENIMTVAVKVSGGQLDPKAQKLWTVLQATRFRQVGILLHQRNARKL